MQEKVDKLIDLTQKLNNQLKGNENKNISSKLNHACFCLKSHDLIGLDIILKVIHDNHYSFVNKADEKDSTLYIDKVSELALEIKKHYDKNLIPISDAEELFLSLGYNKFLEICEEIYSKEFWGKTSQYRFSQISQVFSIYSELLNYAPFKGVLKWLSRYRPPMESEISGSLFKFIRNVLVHFPFYDAWDDVWISKKLVNWDRPNRTIDLFLKDYCGKSEIKYRYKKNLKSDFSYVSINFPREYDDQKIYLKDIISEEEGIKFVLVMMIRVLNTQIESIDSVE